MSHALVRPEDHGDPARKKFARLVIFAPMPPKQNGIADYVIEQLPFHARYCETLVVIDNADPPPVGLPGGVRVLRLAEYLRQRPVLSRFPHLYHIGNNPDHGYLLSVLYSTPGVVVVHDLGLHHLIDTQTLVCGNFAGYAWALWQQYGRFGKILGRQFLDYRVKGQAMPRELTLNGAVIDGAQHVIVHSDYSADKIRSEWPGKPVTVIPHHLSPAVRGYNPAHRPEYRKALALPMDGTLITSLGFINRPKQIAAILEALADLKGEGLDFTYVLAGKCRRDEYDVFADIERLNLADRVIVTGYLDDDAFFKHVAAADLVLNLRYPTLGETSGTLVRALGMGRCCVVVDIGPFAEIPQNCAVMLAWDGAFPVNLRDALRALIESPALRRNYEIAARDWISATHGIHRTTDAYHQVIESILPGAGVAPVRLGQPGTRTATYQDKRSVERQMCQSTAALQKAVSEGAGHLWWRESFVAVAEPGDRIGLLAAPSEPVAGMLREWLGYGPGQIEPLEPGVVTRVPLDPASYRRFPRLLAVISMTRLAADPISWLAAMNWRLEMAGELVLALRDDLPAQPGQHEFAMSMSAWTVYLEAAGFEVLARFEAPADITFSGLAATAAEPTFRARKLTERIDRFPKPYYAGLPAVHIVLATQEQGLPPMPADAQREVPHG